MNEAQMRTSFDWGKRDWLDGQTLASLGDLLTSPRPDLLTSIECMRAQLTSTPTFQSTAARRLRRRGLDNGDEIDPDRFLRRDANMWERVEKMMRPHRTITIACNASIPGCCLRNELVPRGAAICALADWLSSAGYNVAVHACFSSAGMQFKGEQNISFVCAKPATMPLDIGSIATALCEVSYVRGVILHALTQQARGQICASLGQPKDLDAATAKRLGFDIVTPTGITTMRAALQWLKSTIETLSSEQAT